MPTPCSPEPGDVPGSITRRRGRVARGAWLTLGLVMVGIAFVGIFVPLLPTTDFLLLAVACFARSSPRLEAWLLNHPRFGPGIRAWRTQRAIAGRAKWAAYAGMLLGYGLLWFVARPAWWVRILVGLVLAACAAWIFRRPEPDGDG